jgi:hypothetical protein
MLSADALEFPTKSDWKRIYNSSPFQGLFSLLAQLENSEFGEGKKTQDFCAGIELQRYLYEVWQRLRDVARSYILMMYYYEKGIPDKRWYVSPSKDEHSIRYYPDFTERHFQIKGWFDFYSDTFYYKLFSAWDLVGHMINVAYGLGIKKRDVYFSAAVDALGKKGDEPLHKCLNKLQQSKRFKRAKNIRKDITHNYLPNVAGIKVHRSDDSKSLSLKASYITSESVVANTQEALDLFAKTIEILLASVTDKSG